MESGFHGVDEASYLGSYWSWSSADMMSHDPSQLAPHPPAHQCFRSLTSALLVVSAVPPTVAVRPFLCSMPSPATVSVLAYRSANVSRRSPRSPRKRIVRARRPKRRSDQQTRFVIPRMHRSYICTALRITVIPIVYRRIANVAYDSSSLTPYRLQY